MDRGIIPRTVFRMKTKDSWERNSSVFTNEQTNEQRARQQLLKKHDWLVLSFQHRQRQEQRCIDVASSAWHRPRYMLRGSYRLAAAGRHRIGYDALKPDSTIL